MPLDLAYETAVRLSAVLKLTDARANGSPSLRFPPYRSGKPRVSEQEARVLMCQVLEENRRRYSIEYPTTNLYSFSGQVPLSARTDLLVWGDAHPELAVEFKAGQPTQSAIDKDLEKLVLERVPGLWFHTLHSANSATLPTVFDKLRVGLARGVEKATMQAESPIPLATAAQNELTFGVAVLRGKHAGLWTQTVLLPGVLDLDQTAWSRRSL